MYFRFLAPRLTHRPLWLSTFLFVCWEASTRAKVSLVWLCLVSSHLARRLSKRFCWVRRNERIYCFYIICFKWYLSALLLCADVCSDFACRVVHLYLHVRVAGPRPKTHFENISVNFVRPARGVQNDRSGASLVFLKEKMKWDELMVFEKPNVFGE